MHTIKVDLAVLGGGMAGLPIAHTAAAAGQRTVLCEQDLLGGTCLNRGCIPTKTLIESARVAHLVRTAGRFGVEAAEPGIDLAAIVTRKNGIVEGARAMMYTRARSSDNLTLIEERAVFEGPGRLRVGDTRVEAERIIINTGARPTLPSVKGLADLPYLTSRTLLDVTELPPSLLVVGGGYVGCEFAQMFSRFGSKVTILQKAAQLLAEEGTAVAETVTEVLRGEGIHVLLNAQVTEAERTGDGIRLTSRVNGNTRAVEGSAVLIAVGRTPNSDELNLDAVGVDRDAQGFIVVDDGFQTSGEGIWAIGDVVGGPMFTHSARDDADLLYRRIFTGEDVTTRGRQVPFAIFTDPEVAAVGLTEEAARRQGYRVIVGTHPFAKVGRALAMGSTQGFVALVAEAETGTLLGAQIVGPHAGELIHEMVLALEMGATCLQISRSMHVHPTLAEGIQSAAAVVVKELSAGR